MLTDTHKAWLVANLEIALFIVSGLLLLLTFPLYYFSDMMTHWIVIAIVSISLCMVVLGLSKCAQDGIGQFVLALVFVLGLGLGFIKTMIHDSPVLSEWLQVGRNHRIVISDSIVIALLSLLGSLYIARYAYRHFEEVVSRRYLYRTSNTEQFSGQLRYMFNRLFISFLAIFSVLTSLILVIQVLILTM